MPSNTRNDHNSSHNRVMQEGVHANITVTSNGGLGGLGGQGGNGGAVSDSTAGDGGDGGHGGTGEGGQSYTALGIGHDSGSSKTLVQVSTYGNITNVTNAGTGGIGGTRGSGATGANGNGMDGNDGGAGLGRSGRTNEALGIGRSNGTGINLMLFSGGNGTLPAINIGDSGSCNPSGVIDRSGYNVNDAGCSITKLNTTQPQHWRAARDERCSLVGCDSTSCHYVHERFHTLAATGSNRLILLSRQEYPFGVEGADAQGVFRITRLTRGNGTSPALDMSFGKSSSGYLLYPAPSSGDVLQPNALLVSKVVNEQHLTCLYRLESGGIQIVSFPLGGTEDNYYEAATHSLPGEPVLLSNNGNTVWMQEGNCTIRRYDQSGLILQASDQRYNLLDSMCASRPVIAVGKDSQWLYIARALTENQQVMLERFNLQTTFQDDSWKPVLESVPVTAQSQYDLMVENNQITLLPRGVIAGQNVETSSGLQVTLPKYGGCAHWATTQVITTNGGQPMTTTMLMPSSSSPIDGGQTTTMLMPSSSSSSDGGQPMSTGTPNPPSGGITLNNIVIPAAAGGTVVTVACIVTTGGVICCCAKAIKKKKRRKVNTSAGNQQFELTRTVTLPPAQDDDGNV